MQRTANKGEGDGPAPRGRWTCYASTSMVSSAPPPVALALIEKLPKTDLHVHLDGSLRIGTILDLAEQQGIELPARDPDGLRAAMHIGESCGSLVDYLKAFDVTLSVMQTEEALRRSAYELGEDAAAERLLPQDEDPVHELGDE